MQEGGESHESTSPTQVHQERRSRSTRRKPVQRTGRPELNSPPQNSEPQPESKPAGASSSPISSDQAEKLLKLEVANITKKLASGRTLSGQERAILQSIAIGKPSADTPGLARNQVELADALGVTRQTINVWLKESGCPGAESNGTYVVSKWLDWARNTNKKANIVEDEASLRANNLLLQNEHLETKIAILNREFIPASDVEEIGSRLAAAIRKVVCSLHLSAPSLVGRSVQELDAFLKDKEDEIISQLHILETGIDDLKDGDSAEEEEESPAS